MIYQHLTSDNIINIRQNLTKLTHGPLGQTFKGILLTRSRQKKSIILEMMIDDGAVTRVEVSDIPYCDPVVLLSLHLSESH